MKPPLFFSSLVYLTTNILAPLLSQMATLFEPSTNQYYGNDTGAFFLMILVGLVLCIPSWLLLSKLTSALIKKNMAIIKAKSILMIASIFLFLFTLGLMNYNYIFNYNYWPSVAETFGSYPIVLILSISLYYNIFFGKNVPHRQTTPPPLKRV